MGIIINEILRLVALLGYLSQDGSINVQALS